MKVHPYYHSWQKRAFDLVLSSVVIVVTLPFWVVIGAVILLTSGWPIIFTQKRYGKDKKAFTLLKFRTMKLGAERERQKLLHRNEAPAPMFKMENDPRFVGIGKLLSNTGLDELPQLLNIISGEMSLVGPRPLPLPEANQLDKNWDFRYIVKPGIFSHWAFSPERYTSLKAWLKLEMDQLKHGSIYKDCILIYKILVSLAHKVLKYIFTQIGLRDFLLKERN